MIERPDPANLQGLIEHGYTHRCSAQMLFQFESRPAARAFIGALLDKVQSGKRWGANKPEWMLNISLTFTGLSMATNLSDAELEVFPLPFTDGPDKRRPLHDSGASASKNWWNGSFRTADIHCIVHAYALEEKAYADMIAFVTAAAAKAGARELFPLAGGKRLEQWFLPDKQIHFGYRDGLSDPRLAWPEIWPSDGQDTPTDTLNNFVIGYPSSHAMPGPVETKDDPTSVAPARIAKDGSYLAFRVLAQDVAAFEKFLDEHAPAAAEAIGKPVEHAREWLAAKLMGRWRNGSPLSVSPDAPSDVTRDVETFSFNGDNTGAKCPLSAHVRVSNPRDQPQEPADAEIPRLIRRGLPYGPPPGKGDGERGLVGIFLCGSLLLQFEKLNTWFFENNFSPLFPAGVKPQDA
ncbi:MAG TPA: hypothetical protein VN181_11455, partial [Thermoanaerobaculia bacterium]|nr:hypothetical protein [Thermoanaerobaculia bacterium]